jgi:WD40-like Beta Propeller Repeat
VGGGEAVQVTKNGGTYATESPDGSFLYYLRSSQQEATTELWRIPVQGGEEMRILASVWPQIFAVVERGIYFFSGKDRPSLQFFDLAIYKSEMVARLKDSGGSVLPGLSVSPDGRWLLYSRWEGRGSDLIWWRIFGEAIILPQHQRVARAIRSTVESIQFSHCSKMQGPVEAGSGSWAGPISGAQMVLNQMLVWMRRPRISVDSEVVENMEVIASPISPEILACVR